MCIAETRNGALGHAALYNRGDLVDDAHKLLALPGVEEEIVGEYLHHVGA
jgi:hypothetical protein